MGGADGARFSSFGTVKRDEEEDADSERPSFATWNGFEGLLNRRGEKTVGVDRAVAGWTERRRVVGVVYASLRI